MDKFKEIMSVEQNSFADERFSRNGGGYLQPHIVYDYQGEKVELFDNNTGEYGNEYTVVYAGCEFWYSTKGKTKKLQQALQKSTISLLMIGMSVSVVTILYGTVMMKLYVLSEKKSYINLQIQHQNQVHLQHMP